MWETKYKVDLKITLCYINWNMGLDIVRPITKIIQTWTKSKITDNRFFNCRRNALSWLLTTKMNNKRCWRQGPPIASAWEWVIITASIFLILIEIQLVTRISIRYNRYLKVMTQSTRVPKTSSLILEPVFNYIIGTTLATFLTRLWNIISLLLRRDKIEYSEFKSGVENHVCFQFLAKVQHRC